MVLYKSIFMYKSGRFRAKIKAKVGIGAQKEAGIKLKVLISLVKTFGAFLISSSLSVKGKLQQIYGLNI